MQSRNLAARAGKWSAQHRKTAILGWILFVVLATFAGSNVGKQELAASEMGNGESKQAAMLADAARRVSDVDATGVIPSSTLRRAGLQAATVMLVLLGILFVGREPARQALDAGSLKLFPGRLTLEVTPGNARIKAGTTLDVEAHLVGNTAPVIAQMQIADGDRWRGAEMATAKPGMPVPPHCACRPQAPRPCKPDPCSTPHASDPCSLVCRSTIVVVP